MRGLSTQPWGAPLPSRAVGVTLPGGPPISHDVLWGKLSRDSILMLSHGSCQTAGCVSDPRDSWLLGMMPIGRSGSNGSDGRCFICSRDDVVCLEHGGDSRVQYAHGHQPLYSPARSGVVHNK